MPVWWVWLLVSARWGLFGIQTFLKKRCGSQGEEVGVDRKAETGLDVMTGRPGAFHKKHGQHIRLLEEDTVAHRIDSYNKGVVFTDQPIPQGSMFQVKLLDKGGGWAGSIVSTDIAK